MVDAVGNRHDRLGDRRERRPDLGREAHPHARHPAHTAGPIRPALAGSSQVAGEPGVAAAHECGPPGGREADLWLERALAEVAVMTSIRFGMTGLFVCTRSR